MTVIKTNKISKRQHKQNKQSGFKFLSRLSLGRLRRKHQKLLHLRFLSCSLEQLKAQKTSETIVIHRSEASGRQQEHEVQDF